MEFEEGKLEETAIKQAALYLDPKYSADDVAAIAGFQLEFAVQSYKSQEAPSYMSTGVDLKTASRDGKRGFKELIMSILSKLRKSVCVWWEKNKEKTGTMLVGGLSSLIKKTNALPDFAVGLAAIVAVFLIKKGIDWLCKGALPKSI